MAGTLLESAAPVPVALSAALAAELAAEPSDSVAEESWEASEPVRLEPSDAMLLMAESAALSMEEAAEAAAEPPALVTEAAAEVISEPIDEAAEARSEGTPPTAEVIWEMMESTWALATPAAMTAVAMVEKRILVD